MWDLKSIEPFFSKKIYSLALFPEQDFHTFFFMLSIVNLLFPYPYEAAMIVLNFIPNWLG